MTQEEITVPKNWKKVFLEDVCKIVSGNGFPKAYQNLVSTGIPFIKVSDMNLNGNEKHILTSNFSVNDKIIKKINAKKYPEGTIIFPKIGGAILTNKKRILSKSSCFDNNVMGLIPNKEINGNFFYYVIQGLHLKDFIKNGPIPSLDTKKFIKFQFLLPPLSIQKQIVAKLDHILGELEVKKKETLSLIEQNKERIEFFEKNWMSYVIDREIEKHPQRKEWESKKLSEVSNKITDGAHKTPTYVKEGIPFLRVTDIKNKDISWDAVKRIPKKEHEELIKRSKPEFEDILYSKNGTIGRSIVINWKKEFSIFVSLALIKPKRNILNPYFLKMFLDSKSAISQATKRSKTASVTNLHLEEIRDIIIMLPPLPTQKKIVQNIKNAEEKFQLQKKQFENIKNNYDSKINYINHIQS
ncbi:MAG: restriction endonuclease subunit S, partial [Candidatus Nitrosopelagicus sp.]|nr:restriction endonuclease subunit S [Candidatus Nitrosopelagicus sp.]